MNRPIIKRKPGDPAWLVPDLLPLKRRDGAPDPTPDDRERAALWLDDDDFDWTAYRKRRRQPAAKRAPKRRG